MSAFKVGQRVRKIAHGSKAPDAINEIPIGTEGVIVARGRMLDWRLRWDGYGGTTPDGDGHWGAMSWQLVPLLDPGADAFMERIRKLGREPINEIEKVTK